jgi:uncharacterized protein (DUF1778 family)
MPEEKVGRGKQRQDRAALEAALLNRSGVTIPAKDWSAFKAWIERPAETMPALAELARRTPSWAK